MRRDVTCAAVDLLFDAANSLVTSSPDPDAAPQHLVSHLLRSFRSDHR